MHEHQSIQTPADGSEDDMRLALGTIVRLALRRGVGLPGVVSWAQRAAGGASLDAAPAVTDLLCDSLMRQRGHLARSDRTQHISG